MHACVLSVIKSELLMSFVVSKISSQTLNLLWFTYSTQDAIFSDLRSTFVYHIQVHDGELILTNLESVLSSTATS